MPSMPCQPLTRREFVKHSAVAGLALGAGRTLRAQTTQPAQASRPARIIGANERIRIGLIGCGGLGTDFHIPKLLAMSKDPTINIELAAVCDIYEPRKQRAKKLTGAELFHDYRKLLDRQDIHGVVIVTPDHWHAKMTLDAMEAGKDVHVEKPMALYWEEAREMYRTAERLGRVVQVGAEGTSRDIYWQANQAIREGKIGKPVWVTGGVYRNVPSGDWNWPMDPDCSPRNLDWDAFLGPAPKRPFEPERFFRFRKYWDYSGGLATDLLSHVLSAVQVCMGPEFPSRVSAAGGIYCHHDRETPDTFHMMVEYPSQYTATLFCTQDTQSGVEMCIRGEHASIRLPKPAKHDAEPEGFLVLEAAFSKDTAPQKIATQPRMGHDENFIACMRTRAKPHCDALAGYKTTVALALAVRSWREGRLLTFEPVKQEIA